MDKIKLTIEIDPELLDNYVGDQHPFSMRREDQWPVLNAVLAACKEQSILFHACPECGEPVHDNNGGAHMTKNDGTFCFGMQLEHIEGEEVPVGAPRWDESVGYTLPPDEEDV